jgi:ABC-type multidrug transport system fused ATPase/permease subunit
LATIGAIAFLAMVNVWMAGLLAAVSCGMIAAIFHIAAAGKPLYSDFADKAAEVDGEMADVIGNISMVKAFGGLSRASSLRQDRGAGVESSPPEPALSGEAQAHACPRHCHSDSRFACLRDPSLAAS